MKNFDYLCSKEKRMEEKKFKSFNPKIDTKRRLVLTRFYTGVKGEPSFCYLIHRITKKNTIDKRFKHLFAYGDDDYKSVKEFHHVSTGQPVRIFKSAFKSVFKITNKLDVLEIWNSTLT